MPEPFADDALCAKGLAVLEDQLGPVQALRFLALISRQPFDYQQWCQQHFGGMSLADILSQAEALSRRAQGESREERPHDSAPNL